MKAYDPSGFAIIVTEDYTWRVREISDLKQIIRLSGDSYSPVARKAALTLVYAHWEGHVHFVANAYLTYIARRRLQISALAPAFQAVYLGAYISEWQNQRDSIGLRLKIVETIRETERGKFKKIPKGAVNTGGNLNFTRFSDICQILTLDPKRIIQDEEFLDNELVGARNRIAHGDEIVVSAERLDKVSTFVLEIMRLFRTDVENSIISRSFSRTS